MIVKVYFEKGNDPIPFDNQHVMNGVIYRVINKGGDVHDAFSPYSVSSVQGCYYDSKEGCLRPYDKPYIRMSSSDLAFADEFVRGVEREIEKGDRVFFGRRIVKYECSDFVVGREYDVVKTLSPVIVKNNGVKITCDDEGWEEALVVKCAKKLERAGIVDDGFRIEFGNRDNVKKKIVRVGEVFNPCTSFVCVVYGRPSTRKCLYNMGIGGSTGSGFGAVEVLQSKK